MTGTEHISGRYTPPQRWIFLAILFLVSTCNYVDRHLMAVLIQPIKTEFGASDTMMGLLTGFAFAVCYAVLGLPMARIADRGDRRLVISISVAVWSIMTALCGVAQNFIQLALARVGVGIGEAGAIPPAQSLIADYFPPEQRTRAIGVFMSSAMLGYVAAFAGGGYLASAYGWRSAFVIMGLPGIVLAVIAAAVLKEPRRDAAHPANAVPQERFATTLRVLAGKRSFVLLNAAMLFYFLCSYGALIWVPTYLVRVMGGELAHVGAVYGVVAGVSAVVGTIGGSVIIDRLTKQDQRWLVRAPAVLLVAAMICLEFALITPSVPIFYAAFFVASTGLNAAVPSIFSALHAVCGSARRAMAIAICFFVSNLLGLGFGPLITGMLSDYFTALHGPVGLRYAVMIAFLVLVPSAMLLWASARRLLAESEA